MNSKSNLSIGIRAQFCALFALSIDSNHDSLCNRLKLVIEPVRFIEFILNHQITVVRNQSAAVIWYSSDSGSLIEFNLLYTLSKLCVIDNFSVNLLIMAIPTRSSTSTPENEAIKEFVNGMIQTSLTELANSITTMNNTMNKVTNDLQGVLIQQQYLNTDVQMLKNFGGFQSGGQSQYGRLTRIEFTKFSGEDVKGWIYRCQQFFSIDGIA